jgi:GNAT superfamily N-acetyltransferase
MTRPDVRLAAHARVATIDDKDQLFRLTRAFANTRGLTIDDETRLRGLDLLLSVPAVGRFLVVEERGGLAGYAAIAWAFDLRHCGRTAWMTELYVVPEWRGAGRAKALLDLAKTTARDAGAHALHFLSAEADKDAVRLYRAMGAGPDARRIHTVTLS